MANVDSSKWLGLKRPEVAGFERPLTVLEMLKRTLVQPQATAASATSAASPGPQSGVKRCFSGAWNGTKSLFCKAGCGLAFLWERLKMVRHIKAPLLLAVGVGTVSGFAAYFAGPWMAVGLGWLGGFATTLAVHAGLWLRRIWQVPFSHGAFRGNGVPANGLAHGLS